MTATNGTEMHSKSEKLIIFAKLKHSVPTQVNGTR